MSDVRKSHSGKVLIFDFDKSLVDQNTDDWVPHELAPDLLAYIRQEWRNGRQWTELMDEVATKLHERGFKKEDLERALQAIPFHPDMFAALKEASSLGVPCYIVSDANEFYIDAIVKHHGLAPYLKGIVTNPSHFDETGRLRIQKFCSDSSHGCSRCPVNMCKGWILRHRLHVVVKTERVDVDVAVPAEGKEATSATVTATSTVTVGASSSEGEGAKSEATDLLPLILYVGDGSGDVCPVLHMHDGCVACAREGHPMLKELLQAKEEGKVRAKVVPWKDGSDVLAAVREFLGSPAGSLSSATADAASTA